MMTSETKNSLAEDLTKNSVISNKNSVINGKPSFFYDDSEKDESELLLDYYLSWTIRCAVSKNMKVNSKVKDYSQKILLKFLESEIKDFSNSEIEILEVKTYKQWERIDIVAEVKIMVNNKIECFAILFENKLYTRVHHDQLLRYKVIFDNFYYNVEEKKHYKKIYMFLTCLEEVEGIDEVECKKAGYNFLTFQDLRDLIGSGEETGDVLFDEFWFRYY